MKLWIDDLRPMPTSYTGNDDWAQTSVHAINYIRARNSFGQRYEEISFDHDLGGGDTTRPVMLWMIENSVWPQKIVVHSANRVGVEWLRGMATRYGPDDLIVI